MRQINLRLGRKRTGWFVSFKGHKELRILQARLDRKKRLLLAVSIFYMMLCE